MKKSDSRQSLREKKNQPLRRNSQLFLFFRNQLTFWGVPQQNLGGKQLEETPLYGKPLKTFYQVRQTCLNSERYLLHVTSTTRHTGAHQYEVPFRLEVQCQNALQKLAFFPKLLLCCPLKDTDLWERKLWQLQNHGPIMIWGFLFINYFSPGSQRSNRFSGWRSFIY